MLTGLQELPLIMQSIMVGEESSIKIPLSELLLIVQSAIVGEEE